MKRVVLFCIIIIICSITLIGYEEEDIYRYNWEIYTNTTYIHQIFCKEDSIIAATWGGVSIFNRRDSAFSTLVRSNGLSKNEVRSVHYIPLIDELWFGCYKEGISRYKDGEFLRPYQENQGVEGYYINDIDDNDEYIFIGTEKGLCMFEIFENSEPLFRNTFDAPRWLSDNNVNCITFDDSNPVKFTSGRTNGTNRIWVGTDQGLDYAIINYDSMMVADYWWHHIISGEKITAIDYCGDKIYFGTENGIGIIDSLNNLQPYVQFPVFSTDLPTPEISAILCLDDTTIWVALGKWNETHQKYDNAKGIGRYNWSDSIWTFWDEETSILCNQISDIKVDNEENVWVSTWEKGLYCYKDKDWEHYKKNCISSNIVAVMMFDNNNDLWCGFSRLNLAPASKKGVSKFDASKWINYNINNSGLGNNTVYSLCEDKSSNIWFGHWGGSNNISVLDSSETQWTIYKKSDTDWIKSTSISILQCDEYGNMWIGGYAANPGGMTILEPDGFYHLFEPKVLFPEGGQNHATMLTVLLQEEKVWLGCYHTGIQYWDGQGFPQTYQAGDTLTLHWHSFAGAEGKSCFDFDVQRTNYGNYIFAGCIDGLYMYDEDWDDWYKFTSGLAENVKQYYWDGSEWEKQDWGYYWIGETRLGSGIYNMINDVFVDPHGRKWLATNGGGISMLDETNYYFTNFNTENSDLCSDVVLSFAYNPYTGKLFAGTSEGLCSFDIGASKKDELASRKVKKLAVYPNPFKPAEHNYIYFQAEPDKNLPTGKNKLYIYNLTGELVAVLNESDLFRFFWDGRNKAGKPVASGIYFWVLSSQFDDVYLNGKFAVIR